MAQNKFNTRQSIQNLTGPLPTLCAQTLLSPETTVLGLTLFALPLRERANIYRLYRQTPRADQVTQIS